MKKPVFVLRLTMVTVTVATAALFASCSKNQMSIMDGTYVGKHILHYSSDHDPLEWDISMTFSGNKVIMSDGSDAHNGHNGRGTFSVKRNKLFLEFEPRMVLAIYMTTPVIGGECDY